MRKLAALILLTACGSSITAPPQTAQGVWSLHTVAGMPMPYRWNDATAEYEILADTLTIAPNGVFTEKMTLWIDQNGLATTTTASYPGTYSAYTTNSLQFVYADGSGYGAVWSGNTLTVQPGTSGAEIYQRQ